MGVLKPELILKSAVPVVMAGILGIYGMIVSVILAQKSKHNSRLFASNHLPTQLKMTVPTLTTPDSAIFLLDCAAVYPHW